MLVVPASRHYASGIHAWTLVPPMFGQVDDPLGLVEAIVINQEVAITLPIPMVFGVDHMPVTPDTIMLVLVSALLVWSGVGVGTGDYVVNGSSSNQVASFC